MKKTILSVIMIAVIFSMSACSGNKAGNGADTGAITNDVSIEELHNAVKSAYGEDYIPSMPYDDASLMDVFGVEKAWYEEYIAEGPMISAHVDTFVAVKAKNGSIEDVKKALNEYRDKLLADTMQYPSNLAKIQASRVVSYGNYTFFIMLGIIPMETEEEGEEAMLTAYEEQNGKAVTAIEGLLLK